MRFEGRDHLKVMRTASWMWVIYLACQVVIDLVIYNGRFSPPIQWYYAINFLPALLFSGLAYSPLLRKHHDPTTAIMILLVSIVPVVANPLFEIRLPQVPLSNIEGMAMRQLPVLMIGLVLVAWHFRLLTVMIYTIAVSLLELGTVSMFTHWDDPKLQAYDSIILIRTICFLVVGIFINMLINRLRAQQESLRTANHQLASYAGTLETLTLSRERNRMSRELHDTVVHTLSGLAVQLETSRVYMDIDRKVAGELVEQALEATRKGLQETRRALKELRASPLEDLGLIRALQQLARSAAERAGLILQIQLPETDPSLPADVEQCVYRIAQEAIENTVHHASARQLILKLFVNESDLRLLIQDDGAGFAAGAEQPAGHFGLTGMKERAQLVGGDIRITSQSSHGTSVELIVRGAAR